MTNHLERIGEQLVARETTTNATLVEVESSDIAAIGRFGTSLVIKFNTGAIYVYDGAEPLHDELMRAESKGKFFHRFIRGKFDYARLERSGGQA